MRTVGLLVLVILLPTFVHAAVLVNINTADAELLDTLPGVGSVIAGRIIDYRNANGPFATIEDIQKVSGIGSGSTYAKIAPLITVGDTSTSNVSNSTDSASSTQSVSTSSGSASTYTPPPSSLSVDVSGAPNAVLEVPLRLSARATMKGGGTDSSAQISWSFGDGSSSSGTVVEKTYHYAGTYLVTVNATDGPVEAHDEITITVKPASVRIVSVSGDGIIIANDSNDRLDLSGWRLTSDMGIFRIPDGMVILPQANVLFPFTITNLPMSLEVTLSYPDGIIAARSTPPPATVQLSESAQSSYEVQAVEPAPNTKVSGTAHEITAVDAPAATTELAAAGAALPSSEAAPVVNTHVSGFLHSPWTLGFLGVMALAGGAFILL